MEFLAGVFLVIAIVIALKMAGRLFPKRGDKIHLSRTRRRNLDLREKRRLDYIEDDSYPKP
jgi:hypothetical protein